MFFRMFCTIVLLFVWVVSSAWGQTGGTGSQPSTPSQGQKEGQGRKTKQTSKNKPSKTTGQLEERPLGLRYVPPINQVAAQSAQVTANAETLSGTLTIVDMEKKLVVLMTSDSVPYDFVVNAATKITVAGSKAKMEALSGQSSKRAFVTFTAMKRKGNIAKSIELTE